MSLDDSGLAIAEQATRALSSLERYGHVLRPAGSDETAWRLEMLDELARAGRRLAGAVARVAGSDDPAVVATVRDLSSAVDLHADRVLRAVRDRPRGPVRWAGSPTPGVVPFPLSPRRPDDEAVRSAPAIDAAVERAVIGTAAELLMVRHGCGLDAAYALILERARDAGTSTYEVASRVVDES